MCISIVERVYSCRFVSIYNCLALLADVCSFGSLIGRFFFFFCTYCYPSDATHDCLPFVCIFFCFSVLFCFFLPFFFFGQRRSLSTLFLASFTATMLSFHSSLFTQTRWFVFLKYRLSFCFHCCFSFKSFWLYSVRTAKKKGLTFFFSFLDYVRFRLLLSLLLLLLLLLLNKNPNSRIVVGLFYFFNHRFFFLVCLYGFQYTWLP